MRQKLNSLGRTPSTMFGEHQVLLITILANTIPVVPSCYGGASQRQGQGDWSELREW
ncbi:hypothetical protein LDENG_00083230 [Lucifuga dentata]|nr:hypothetical protein LDENG_00083230 [Lucifuga dentata]